MNDEVAVKERVKQMSMNVMAGKKIKEVRESRGYSLRKAGELFSVSANYLSEIERGIKKPSEQLISEIAVRYEMDEIELFRCYQSTPPSVNELLKEDEYLLTVLFEMAKMDKDRKDVLVETMKMVGKIMA